MLKKRMLDIKPDFELCQVCAHCGNLYAFCSRLMGDGLTDRMMEGINLTSIHHPGPKTPSTTPLIDYTAREISPERIRRFIHHLRLELNAPNDLL